MAHFLIRQIYQTSTYHSGLFSTSDVSYVLVTQFFISFCLSESVQWNFFYQLFSENEPANYTLNYTNKPDSTSPNPDCIVNIMKALVKIHVASSEFNSAGLVTDSLPFMLVLEEFISNFTISYSRRTRNLCKLKQCKLPHPISNF